jgi:hypothetical protein
MPTLEEWEQALVTPRRVSVESSLELLAEVERRHVAKDAKRNAAGQAIPPRKGALTPVDEFAPEVVIEIVPAHMLHRLGVATTPPIENLADICSTWAHLRYLWAFEVPPPGATHPPLRLSADARNIDFHQKGLLSDQIGIGMAAMLLGQYLDAPLPVDVSVAMSDPAWPIVQQHDASPDYIFFNSSQTSLFIVECKGTQTSRSNALDQLRRGSEQVPSLTFTDRPNPPSLVVATYLSQDGTRVFVVDPPGDDDPEDPREYERTSQRDWRVRDSVDFGRATRLISEAKLLTFAGATQMATSKVERARTRSRVGPTILPRELTTTENEFGTFRGMRQSVGTQDRFNVEIFQGLNVDVFDALVAEEPARTDEQLQRFRARARATRGDPTQEQPVNNVREHGGIVVRSAGPDGSLFQIRVVPP